VVSGQRRVLLFGVAGQVGGAVLRRLGGSCEVIAPGLDEADFSDPESLRVVIREAGASVIVNAAAYTAVDRAESEEELARAVNARAPAVIAAEAARSGALLIHYSTDYVYDGSGNTPWREDMPTGPLSVYGRTKLEGDVAIAAAGPRHAILRTSWVYSPGGSNFLLTMRRLFRERDEVRVVNDQHGSPTSAATLADATMCVLDRSGPWDSGVYHITARGHTTWHGFAARIHRELLESGEELRCRSVVPLTSEEFPTAARRPSWSVLDHSRFAEAFGHTTPRWQDDLRAVVEELLGG